MAHTVIHVFPGQGDFSTAPLRRSIRSSGIVKSAFEETFQIIDQASSAYGIPPLEPVLLGRKTPSSTALAAGPPGMQQLALYGTQIAVHRSLCTIGLAPDRVLGVSFGEAASLVAAGVTTVEDGAHIALQITLHLLRSPGGMTLISASPDRATRLIKASGAENTVIACTNTENEVLVTSPDLRELDCVEQHAADESVRAVRLHLPFPAHHPDLSGTAKDLGEAIRPIAFQSARIPAYSAVHARAYAPEDDIRALASQCVSRPFNLPDAVEVATPTGPALWLEAGPGGAMTQSLRIILPPGHLAKSALTDPEFPWETPNTLKGDHELA